MSKATNDRALRIYHDVLGLERLHYGLWQPEDELSFRNLKLAQKRYEHFLIDHMPEDVVSILDVGCGTGAMLSRLKQRNFDAEGLTPDLHQKQILVRKADTRCHFTRFEDFQPSRTYDCILMSESSQYIPLERLFLVARSALPPKGYLMVCDYFIRDHASGIMAKSGHNLNKFMQQAHRLAFEVIHEEDITDRITKTLELAQDIANKVILTADIATEKIRTRHPLAAKLVLRLFKNKIRSMEQEMTLIDAGQFKANKQYQFILLQCT